MPGKNHDVIDGREGMRIIDCGYCGNGGRELAGMNWRWENAENEIWDIECGIAGCGKIDGGG